MVALISVVTVFFVILCVLLGFLILIQQGKGDMGLGGLGASSQMLFGGSGGQDFFEKITWTFGFLFIFGALGISFMKSHKSNISKVATKKSARVLAEPVASPEAIEEIRRNRAVAGH
jgi:protein translocase SecG subunit